MHSVLKGIIEPQAWFTHCQCNWQCNCQYSFRMRCFWHKTALEILSSPYLHKVLLGKQGVTQTLHWRLSSFAQASFFAFFFFWRMIIPAIILKGKHWGLILSGVEQGHPLPPTHNQPASPPAAFSFLPCPTSAIDGSTSQDLAIDQPCHWTLGLFSAIRSIQQELPTNHWLLLIPTALASVASVAKLTFSFELRQTSKR